jgi:hypothetical protein
MKKQSWLGLIAIVLGASAASAQEPVGNYALERGGSRVGTATIENVDGVLVLRTRLTDGTSRPDARRDPSLPARTFRYDSVEPAVGLTNHLNGTLDIGARGQVWTVELTPQNGALKAVIKADGAVKAEEKLSKVTPPKAALLVYCNAWDQTHVNAFQAYAAAVARRYRAAGFTRTDQIKGESWDVVITALQNASKESRPYERLIFIGHGGWDGPIMSGQVSAHSDPEKFAVFVDAVRRGTTPTSKLFSSSCHAGGSNKYEAAREYDNKYRWVDDVAKRTGRTVAGPNGYTSTEYTEQHVFAVLEGQGTTRQEVRWASPQGVRTIPGGGTLAGTAIKPMPPIALPAAPAPTPTPTPAAVPAVTPAVVNQPLGTTH